ncbi:MAG: cupin domain-containing protein [Planctomycetes bacterium]|nr:cupin domain-containing protein [Planctomycetota bacterium]MCH7601833.1 cupin domain-containing protein [Planctomycetota bacterium]
MLIRRADQISGVPMKMEGASGVEMRMMVGRDDGAPNFAMRHFTVEPGGHSPRHQHNYEHEVYVLEGDARVEHDGEIHDISAGDIVFIEPNVLHQFTNIGQSDFKFLCLVPVSFDCGSDEPARTPGS